MTAYLADTNVLLRLLQRNDPAHELTRSALRALQQRGDSICYTPQNLVEFWCVCTRPTNVNGYGLSVADTDHRARIIERLFLLLPNRPEIHIEWRRLVVTHAVSGVQVHDARLAAAMRVHGCSNILTFNAADFARFAWLSAVHPKQIANSQV